MNTLILSFKEGRFEYTFEGYNEDTGDTGDSGEPLLIFGDEILRIFKKRYGLESRTMANFEIFLKSDGIIRKRRKLKAVKPKPPKKQV